MKESRRRTRQQSPIVVAENCVALMAETLGRIARGQEPALLAFAAHLGVTVQIVREAFAATMRALTEDTFTSGAKRVLKLTCSIERVVGTSQYRLRQDPASCVAAHPHGTAPALRRGSSSPSSMASTTPPQACASTSTPMARKANSRWNARDDTVAGVAKSATCLTATSRGGRVIPPITFGQSLDQRYEYAQNPA